MDAGLRFQGERTACGIFLSHPAVAQGTSLKGVHGAAPHRPTGEFPSRDPFIATSGN